MDRPFVWIASGFIAGTVIAAHEVGPLPWAPVLSVVGAALALGIRSYPLPPAIGVVLLFAAAGLLAGAGRTTGAKSDSLSEFVSKQDSGAYYRIEGTVRRADLFVSPGDYIQAWIAVDRVSQRGTELPLRGGVVLRWTSAAFPLFTGDRIAATGPLEIDLSRINPGVGSAEDHLRRNRIHAAMRVRGESGVERLASWRWYSPMRLASLLRHAVGARLSQHVPEGAFPFVTTVWLGDRRRVSNAEYERFLESGTAHVLAVSGVHMGIVYLTVGAITRRAIPHRRYRSIALVIAVFAFALMAGARISSLRAAVMIAIYLAADWFDREPDAPTALSLAAILFALIDPLIVLDGGFQLSFLSIASILTFSEAIHARIDRVPFLLRRPAATALGVQILPLPIAINMFNILPILGPIANLVVIPLVTVVLWLSFLASVFAFVFPPLAALFGHAILPAAAAIEWVNAAIAAVPASHTYLSSPAAVAIVCFYAAALLAYRALRASEYRWKFILAASGALIAAAILWRPAAEPHIAFLDVGHGDATVIATPGRTAYLVDAGDKSGFTDMGDWIVAPYLWAHGIRRLDGLVLTHMDRDHTGGAEYILERFRTAAVYLGPEPTGSEMEARIEAICERHEIPIRRLSRGQRLPAKDAEIEVLHPPADWARGRSDNDQSLVLRVRWSGIDALLTGDIEQQAESQISTSECASLILKAPHHGSKTSSSQLFIDAVAPRAVIISTGRRAAGSVLSREVLDRYAAAGIPAYRTDTLGGIRVLERGGDTVIEAARSLRGYVVAGPQPVFKPR